ncbi:flagellar biosynthetic protein FliO [Xanthobacter sp. V4C-4]|uniref:flagellar biosynthetic protein FliO n=1 Tax=Xanthobacter cornucopiae TaxID=3119924 RepID=UPI0037290DD9
MLQQLFGAELDFSVRLAISVIVIAALLGVTVLVMRRLGGGFPGRAAGRGRQGPRLSIVDALAIDPRRRLVLVRRDDVEHLLLTGGANDVLVEQNITGGYVAAGGVRPALPLEREAQQPAVQAPVQAPAARAPLAGPAAKPPLSAPQRPEGAALPPAAPQPEAVAASVAAAALAAPAGEPRVPLRGGADPRPPLPPEALERAAARLRETGLRREQEAAERLALAPGAAEPAPLPPAERPPQRATPRELPRDTRPGLAEPAPAAQEPVASPDAAAEKPPAQRPAVPTVSASRAGKDLPGKDAPAADVPATRASEPRPDAGSQGLEEDGPASPDDTEDAGQKRLEAILSHVERRKAHAVALRRRLASLPDDQKAATVETIKRIDQQIARLLKEAERINAAGEPVASEPAAAQPPQPPGDAARRGLALLLGSEHPPAQPEAARSAPAAAPADPLAERIAARRAAAEKLAADRAAAEKAAAEKAAADKAAADKAAAEKLAAERAIAEKAAAERARAEKAAADKLAAERLAAEKARAERIAAEKAAAERAAAEKAAADKAAAEKAQEDQIAAEMAAALKAHEASSAERRPEAGADAGDGPGRVQPAVEPRLKEMAQRLDAALSRPTDDKLRLSLSDLLEDIEGAAADIAPAATSQPERPRIPVAPREPVVPRPEPRPRANLAASDYSRFLSDTPPAEAGAGEPRPRPAAKEPFSDGWIRSTRRPDRKEEPTLETPEPAARPARVAEPLAPRAREPLVTARRAEPTPSAALLNALPRIDPEPAVSKSAPAKTASPLPGAPRPAPAPATDKPVDKTAEFLDEFDAEMATLLGRTPSR